MAPPQQPLTPELNEDVTAEIILRISPDKPALLFRASVVCKLWLRTVSDPSFHRYGAFHQDGPLLGFFYNPSSLSPLPGFVPTMAAPSPQQPMVNRYWARWVLDCLHGRVLLRDMNFTGDFVVWDPFSNYWHELMAPWEELHGPANSNAAVLCAMAACDHSCCRGAPFKVVRVGVYSHWDYDVVLAHVYSSESRTWSTPASAQLEGIKCFDTERAAVIGDGIYFIVNSGTSIVKYDLIEHRLSTISVPPYSYTNVILMQNEDGSLGIAGAEGSRIYLWSTMVNAEGVRRWVQRRVIKLEEILPMDITSVHPNAIGFSEGVNVFFISTKSGACTYELKSGRVRKVSAPRNYRGVTPFISFFTPDCACSKGTKESECLTLSIR